MNRITLLGFFGPRHSLMRPFFGSGYVSIGRRPPAARLAHLFCEFYLRLKMVGLTQGLSYSLPATQTDLSDALGVSLVLANRTCAALRREGLATFAQRKVTIHDWDKLQHIAEFDPQYLHLEAKPAVIKREAKELARSSTQN